MFHLRVFSAVCFCAVVVLHSPAFAQTSATNSSTNKIQYAPSVAPPLRVQNDIVAVQVRTTNDTVGAGEIRYAGLFNIGTPNNLPLLFQFPNDPFSSHVNIRVDGLVYSNDPFRTGGRLLTLLSGPSLSDSTIVCVYTAGPVEVRQRLTPKKFSRTTGAILIEYELVNRDGLNAHQAGVLLELDTFINGNDAAPVLTSFGYSRNEQQFDAPALPDFYQAFEGNLVNPGVVAQGTIVGFNAVRPDRLVIGDWSRLSRVQWDYALPANTPYGDSAVLLRWNERTLAPNATHLVASYYGRSDVTTQAGPLTLHLTAPRNLATASGQLTPNPFDVNLLVFNNSGITANAAQATLRLPVGLALVSGEFATKSLAPTNLNTGFSAIATWKVLAQCPLNDIDLSMTVEVSATPNLTNAVTRAIFLPSCSASLPNFAITAQPESATITAGETASFQVQMTALNGFNRSAQLSFFPPTPGVIGTFSPTTILPNGASSFAVQTNRNLVAGEYRFIILGNSAGLTRSDSVRVIVNAAAPLDTLKPVFANPNPANGATSIPLRPKISVEVYDPAPSSGIDQNSVRMFVNGSLVQPLIMSKGAGYLIEHTPMNAFGLNESVSVKVVASDLARPVNRDSALFSFTTMLDVTPPLFTNHNPAIFSSNVPLNTDIIAEVFDDIAGVDSASIVMGVRGSVVRPLLTRLPKGYRIRHVPGKPFPDNTRIEVAIRALDLAVSSNQSFSRYHFITVRDSLAPVVLELAPGPNATNVAANFSITARLRDDLTGVDSAAVRVSLNGNALMPSLKRDGRDLLLTAKPASAPRLNDTMRVKLVFADLASRPNRDSLEYSFFIVEDKAAPFLTDLNPARGASQVPLQTMLIANVRDEIAGVDSSSIKLLVNAQLVKPRLTRVGKEVRVEYGPVTLRDDERVEVEIRAQDLATPANLMQEKYSFTTVRDALAPLVLDLQPSPNATNVARDIEIRGRVRDDLAGVDSAAIRLWLNGLPQTPVLRREGKDFVLLFKPQTAFAFNQTINLRLVVADKARVPNVDTTEYSFAVIEDRRPPFVTAQSPARSASNVPPKTPITFEVRDEIAGVDSANLKLRVNGKEVARKLRGNAAAYSVTFTPDEVLLGANDTVYVEIEASDFSSPPNAMPRESYYYTLSRDRIAPFTAGHKPARNSRNANLDTDLALEILDANPGVDSASIKMLVNGNAAAVRVERVTNGYLVRHKPATRWRDNQTISVKVDAQDLAAPANKMPSDIYTFTTVRDSLAPIARDFSPRAGESNVVPNAVISFVVEDDLTGVESAAFVLRVNGNVVQPSLQPVANGFAVRYDLAQQTLTRDSVRVDIYARDLATQPNDSSMTYNFVTSQDRTPPYLTDFFPRNEATEVSVNTAITFQVRDDVAGVDSASVRLFINGENKAVVISGEPRVLQVRYQPATAFALGQRIEVAVEARDRATPTNVMPRRTFHFTTAEPSPDLMITEFVALGEFQLGKATKVRATLRRTEVAVRESFRIEFKADARVVKDTTIAANTLGASLQLEASVQFDNAGTHVLEVIVDADDRVKEVDEANNRKDFVAQLVETLVNKLVVRPNPFTPNGDAVNDVVEFDFSSLALTNPTLHIFDVNGIAIFLTERASGKRFTWNGRDERGNEVQPGVYLYTLRDSGANVKSGYVVVAR